MGLITPAIRESCNPVAALRSIRASLAVTLSTEGFSDSDPLSFLEQQGMPLDLARARAASALSEIRVLTRNLVVHRYTADGALGPFVTRELIPQATTRAAPVE